MADFVDYYELLQISPNAEPQTIQRVYRLLAARYHPDNPETGHLQTFVQLQEAYAVLSEPAARAEYDSRWNSQHVQPLPIFEMKEFIVGVDAEVNRRLGVLCLLYNQRKSTPESAGMSLLEMEVKMSLPREHLEFTCWYLRDKGLVRRDENTSELLITSAGVDFVEQNIASNRIVNKLLNPARSDRVWTAEDAQLRARQEPREPEPVREP